jgi:shikimate dehydrogenase
MAEFFCLLGESLSHSLSPFIHGLILEELNLQGYYHLFELKREDLGEAVSALKLLGTKGVNVTIPYKVEVIEYLDWLSPEAEKIGAVNTLAFREGRVEGYNTDYYGFGMLLNQFGVEVKGQKVVVLGTGGAAKAVIQYLLDENVSRLVVVSRDPAKSRGKLKGIDLVSYDELSSIKGELIINCTPCGMYPDTGCSPLEKSCLNNFGNAVDLIYNPRKTLFMNWAEDLGLKVVGGLYMLIGQAVKAQEVWQGRKIEEQVIDRIYQNVEAFLNCSLRDGEK